MHYQLQNSAVVKPGGCLIVGVFSKPTNDLPFTPDLQAIVTSLAKTLTEPGSWNWQSDDEHGRVMVIQCGDVEQFTTARLKQYLGEAAALLLKQPIHHITLAIPRINEISADAQLQQMLLLWDNLTYQQLAFKTIKKQPHTLESIDFYLPEATQLALKKAQAIASGVQLTRQLSDLPANHCTPSHLAASAEELAHNHDKISVQVFDKAGIGALKMNALLAVAQGSHEEPRFIELNYQGADTSFPPIVLVGKGITFDSGGLSLKPAMVMDEMKYDMIGGATVLGTIKACVLLNLPINVIGLIPSAENMPGGGAVKPGDIVTSMSGQTVEIINTDAEGRLILADALTYAERFNPQYVIDIATLTGAIIVALGHLLTGLMTTDDELAAQLIKAGIQSQDRCWRMPLEDAYQDALDSPLADMINARFDRTASSITAACFLSRFTKKYRWAHLDIAGSGWITGKKNQATGRPVGLLIEFLQQLANAR